jgi:hypothetical protein
VNISNVERAEVFLDTKCNDFRLFPRIYLDSVNNFEIYMDVELGW